MSEWWGADPVASAPSANVVPSPEGFTGTRITVSPQSAQSSPSSSGGDNWWHSDPEPGGGIADFFKSIPYGMTSRLGHMLSAAGQAANAEMSQPDNPNPTPEEARQALEQNVTGATHVPEGSAGKFGAALGGAAVDPTSYLGPWSAPVKAASVIAGTIGGEGGRQLAEDTPYEIPAMLGGSLLGGVAGAKATAPTVLTPAIEANIAARNIGVEIPRGIASDSPLTRFIAQVVNKMPGGGPMQEGISNALKQTGEAVGTAAEMAGGAADPMAAGQGFKTGIEQSFKPSIKARVDALYKEVGRHVDPNATQSLDATQAAIADIMARRVASGANDKGEAIKTVLGGATRPGGLTYEGIKDLRTRVGEMLDTRNFPVGTSEGELRRIYGSLSDDLKASVQATGGANGMAAFERANAGHKFAQEWKANLDKALGTDRSGEGITAAILRMASNGPTGDLKALTMARAAVPKEVWQDIASTAISNLGKDSKGEFSPNIFINNFGSGPRGLSERGKALLFGDVGSGNVLPYLNDIASVSEKFVKAGKLANPSGTAGHSAAYTGLGAAIAGLMGGSIREPLIILGTMVGNNLTARALSSPATAASVARWVRTYSALATERNAPSMAAFNIASRNLANTMNSQLGSNIQPGDLMRAIQGPKGAAGQDQQN